MKISRIFLGLGLLIALLSPVTISRATTGVLRLTPNHACAAGTCKAWPNEVCGTSIHAFQMGDE
jgi:hypothetical protein